MDNLDPPNPTEVLCVYKGKEVLFPISFVDEYTDPPTFYPEISENQEVEFFLGDERPHVKDIT